jgi:hypothetical protein
MIEKETCEKVYNEGDLCEVCLESTLRLNGIVEDCPQRAIESDDD